ncbi:hypothetical protein [Lysobacter gummosus]
MSRALLTPNSATVSTDGTSQRARVEATSLRAMACWVIRGCQTPLGYWA